MPDNDVPRPSTHAVQIPVTLAHTIAIFTTVCRLLYRWQLSRFWWEDAWAALALICDIGSLAGVWVLISPSTTPQITIGSDWLLLLLTSVLWFARISILCSVVRIANPTRRLRLTAYCIGAMFLGMEAAVLAQKIFICTQSDCWVTNSVAIVQLVTDIISDIILVAAPIWFLQDMKLHQDRRILVISAFSASILITGVTILHSVLLFQEATSATLIIGHIKAALALFVCNALVLVTLVYRLCHKSGVDLEHSMAHSGVSNDTVELTSIIDLPSKFSSGIVDSVTSRVQSEGDAAHTKVLTPNPPAGLD